MLHINNRVGQCSAQHAARRHCEIEIADYSGLLMTAEGKESAERDTTMHEWSKHVLALESLPSITSPALHPLHVL